MLVFFLTSCPQMKSYHLELWRSVAVLNKLNANPAKLSNTLEQFIGHSSTSLNGVITCPMEVQVLLPRCWVFLFMNSWQCFLWYLRWNPISSVHHFTKLCNRVLRTVIINFLFNLLCKKCLLTVKLSCNTYYHCKLSSWEVACMHFLIVSVYVLWR